jgi:hypothetical protein
MASSRHSMLMLYRRIIKHAKVFPSIRRDRLVEEIRAGRSDTSGRGGVRMI